METESSKTSVRSLMTKDVVMMPSEHTVKDAAKVIRMEGVGSLIIMKNNKPAGIMTERDFAVKVVSQYCPPSTNISKIMTTPVIYMRPNESVLKASEIMLENKIRKIPIFDEGKIVGIITATDLVRHFRFLGSKDKSTCPLHPDIDLVQTSLVDGTSKIYCPKCEKFFDLDE